MKLEKSSLGGEDVLFSGNDKVTIDRNCDMRPTIIENGSDQPAAMTSITIFAPHMPTHGSSLPLSASFSPWTSVTQ